MNMRKCEDELRQIYDGLVKTAADHGDIWLEALARKDKQSLYEVNYWHAFGRAVGLGFALGFSEKQTHERIEACKTNR